MWLYCVRILRHIIIMYEDKPLALSIQYYLKDDARNI